MKKLGFISLTIIALIASSLACCFSLPIPGLGGVRGSGDVGEETYEVGGFTEITLSTIGNLYIEQGDEESLVLEAEENLIPYFQVEVDGRVLEISTESGVNLQPTEPVNFYLTVVELDAIVLNGSGDIEVLDLETSQLSVTVNGSGDVDIEDLEADGIRVRIAGSGDLNVSGEVEEQEIDIAGSGVYEARNLESTDAEVGISGSGSATIRVSDRLDVTISGSGSVRYIGSPGVQMTVTGSGSVEQIGD
jgi:hypothetical protein